MDVHDVDVDVVDAAVVHLMFRVLLLVYFRGPVVGTTAVVVKVSASKPPTTQSPARLNVPDSDVDVDVLFCR